MLKWCGELRTQEWKALALLHYFLWKESIPLKDRKWKNCPAEQFTDVRASEMLEKR